MFLSVKDKRATIQNAQEVFVTIEPGEDVGDFLSLEEAKAQGLIEEVPARYCVEVVGRGEQTAILWMDEMNQSLAVEAVEAASSITTSDYQERKRSWQTYGYHCSLREEPPQSMYWQWQMTTNF